MRPTSHPGHHVEVVLETDTHVTESTSSNQGPGLTVRIAATTDRIAAFAFASLALVGMPLILGAPLALVVGASLLLLANRLLAREVEGYLLQLVLMLVVSSPFGWQWRPFGLVVPAILLLAWTRPRVLEDFGIGSGLARRMPPAAVSSALLLLLVSAGWMLTRGHPLLLGGPRGWLAPLASPASIPVFALVTFVTTALLLIRSPAGWWLTPALLGLAALLVHPLDRLILPLLPFWIATSVRRRLQVTAASRACAAWVLGIVVLISASIANRLPLGDCPHHPVALTLHPFREPPGTEIRYDLPEGLYWDHRKVVCPVEELAARKAAGEL